MYDWMYDSAQQPETNGKELETRNFLVSLQFELNTNQRLVTND